ncbi:Membrane bound O-acyl transferase MBOAT family protein [Syntrophobacter sp. SbD2]|nr:Membrane bound O-acyl transferase MBOAT family protein [Syntrophobacter sp. SbD2]
MSLISFEFALFLLLALWLNWALRSRRSVYRGFLLTANALFYASQSTGLLLLPLGVGMSNYLFALLVSRAKGNTLRKVWLGADIILNLGFLVFFKYFEFLYQSLDSVLDHLGLHLHLPFIELYLPIGISFFTFQGLSYCIDVYRDPKELVQNPVDVLLFVSFFPTILSGPIMRARQFVPQLDKPDYDSRSFHDSFVLILIGLFKKLVISSYLSEHIVRDVFQVPAAYSSLTVLLGVYAYSIQIYCDFSGYSDIAIGVAQLLGFRLPQNFRVPYGVCNVQEFWHHWHISFSTWLRDYLYIPLGGSRKGRLRKYANLMATMAIGGLWHGAQGRFLLWGTLHGMALVLTHAVKDIRQTRFAAERDKKSGAGMAVSTWAPAFKAGAWFLTFNLVSFLWIFFRAEDSARAMEVFQAIFAFKAKGIGFESWILPVLAAGLMIQFVGPYALHLFSKIQQRMPVPLQAAPLALLCILIIKLGPSGIPPFIYFQF